MSGSVDPATERQNLLIRLLDAVKQCQVRFGGRRELATEGDSRVTCLCAAWEAALSHGMRHTNKALSTIKQMTEMTGLSKVASNIGIIENIQNMETEPVFWQYVKEHLSKHEVQRYLLLRHVTTDAGRGRAWLRSTLNEHSLEKYMHMIMEDGPMIKSFYEDGAFLRDQERASMLPMMAAGLGSILFAINIDNPDLNTIKPATGLDAILSSTPPGRPFSPRAEEEPRPVIHSDLSPKNERRKERKKKKKIAHIVSFDDDDGTSSYCSTSPGSSVTSPLVKTSGVDLGSLTSTVVAGAGPSTRAVYGFSQHKSMLGAPIAENSATVPGDAEAGRLGYEQSSTAQHQIQPQDQVQGTDSIQAFGSEPRSTAAAISDALGRNLPARSPSETTSNSLSNNEAGLSTYQSSQSAYVPSQRASQVASLSLSTDKLGSVSSATEQLAPMGMGTGQLDPGSLGTGQLGATSLSTGQMGPASSGQGQLGPTSSGTGHLGPTSSLGSGQLGPTSSGTGQLGPASLGTRQLGFMSSGTEQLSSTTSGVGVSKSEDLSAPAPGLNSKMVLNELRCPSLMNGSLLAQSPEEEGPNKQQDEPTKEFRNVTEQKPPVVKEVSSVKSDSITTEADLPSTISSQDATVMKNSDTFEDTSKEKEILIDWGEAGRNGKEDKSCDNVEVGINKPSDSIISDTLPKRADSMTEGYANLVLGYSSTKVPQAQVEQNQPTVTPVVRPPGGALVNQSGITTVVDVSRTETSPSWTNDDAKTDSGVGYQASPNLSPKRGPMGSPYRQASPRPESIKGLDMSDRYKIPRCDSSDSVPGSMSDSVRTNDSLRQRFGRWDSTDSADVRSITSNSSFGEAVSSPTLPQASVEKNMSVGHVTGGASLTPVSPDGRPLEGEFMTPLPATTASSEDSRSYDSIEVPSYTEDTENAAYALAVTQQGFLASNDLQKLGATSPEAMSSESLSPGELKQALIAMMLQKDETERQRQALEEALDVEREVNTALRAESEALRQGAAQMEEKDVERIRALSKENELLKHQLRKYVNAVQMLRRQGAKTDDIPGIHLDEPQPTIPPPRPQIDYSHEASEYEKKLIQVAEMHGELMEFNEVLHRQLSVKEATIIRLKQELTDLRGPLPEDFQMSDDSVSVTSEIDIAALNRPLVNIWIPSAFLRGAGSDAFHVYQVYVRIRDEEWNIYRRYAEFHELHSKLRKKYPIANTYEFPQKKTFGNRDPKFVEERRRKLQIYLRQVINLFLQTNPDFVANVSRKRLLQVAPFFGDIPTTEKKNKSKRKVSRGGPNPRGPAPSSSSPAPQQHYMGL